MKSLSQILTVLSATSSVSARTIPTARSTIDSITARMGYAPTFFESFSSVAAGSLPSSSNWILDLGTSYPGGSVLWGNNEHEVYTDSTSNMHVTEDNKLAITPRLLANGTWTSARIETQRTDFVAVEGGKLLIESRIKLGTAPKALQQGIWPAFWALGESFRGNYTNWPGASEWDFMEVISGGDAMYSTIHCGYAPGGPCNEYDGLSNTGIGGASFSRGVFHTVGFVVDRSMCGRHSNATWEDETLNWYLDGEKVFNISGSTIADEAAWGKLAHEGHFLLLNVAVGGNWPGAPNNATIGGESVGMEVDYVGVWNSV